MPRVKICKKSEYDKFYTKENIAENCVKMILKYCNPDEIYVEPSAGSGNFLKYLPEPRYGFDILPEHPEIIQENWFNVKFDDHVNVVGNPPFGNRNKLTDEFITHSLPFARILGFILPMVYKKESKQKIFPDNWSLVEEWALPRDSFLLENDEFHVPCVFQIWIKNYIGTDLRESKKPKKLTSDFRFCSKEDSNYFVFGAAPSKIILPEEVNTNNRGYYISCESWVVDKLNKIRWENYALSSVSGGAAWFTKQQIIDVWVENNI